MTEEQISFREEILRLNEEFQKTSLDEMTLVGKAGFHTFYDNDGGVANGITTAMHEAFDQTIQEVYVDEDMVEAHQGRVDAKAVKDEVEAQINDFIGDDYWFYEHFIKNLEAVLEEREQEGSG